MAGTIPGIALAANNDANGLPLSGCLLYIYTSGGINAAIAYRDSALTNPLPWPIPADGYGRIPFFWLPDGNYRVRLEDTSGVVVFDFDGLPAVGASSGGGGGGGTSIDPTAILQTGDVLWLPKSGTRPGFVRANGRTIGSASSGASERANSDTQALYTFLYTNFSDTYCPVSGGRGASSAADWAANKPIATLDLRCKSPFGLADMGNSTSTAFSGITFTQGDATTPGANGGESKHTLTLAEAPTGQFTLTDPGHTHTISGQNSVGGSTYPTISATTNIASGGSTGSSTTGVGLTDHAGGGAHNNMPPFVLGTYYVKL